MGQCDAIQKITPGQDLLAPYIQNGTVDRDGMFAFFDTYATPGCEKYWMGSPEVHRARGALFKITAGQKDFYEAQKHYNDVTMNRFIRGTSLETVFGMGLSGLSAYYAFAGGAFILGGGFVLLGVAIAADIGTRAVTGRGWVERVLNI